MEMEGHTREVVVIKTEDTDINAITVVCQEIKEEYEPLLDDEITLATENDQGLSNSFENCVECQSSQISVKPFICGSCGSHYDTICNLHDHIQNHGLGGSYHYDHRSRTAFPKYDSVCSQSQTVTEMLSHMQKSSRRNKPTRPGGILKVIDKSKATSYQKGPARKKLKSNNGNESVHVAADSCERKASNLEEVKNESQSDDNRERRNTSMFNIKTKSNSGGKETYAEHGALKWDCGVAGHQGNKTSRIKKNGRLNIETKEGTTGETHGKDKVVNEARANIVSRLSGYKRDAMQKYTCFKCKLVFSSEEFLQAHMQKHRGALVCDCCNEIFQCLDDLRKHVLDGEGNDLKAVEMFVCSYCHLVVTELKGLLAHLCLSAEDLVLNRQKIRIYTGTVAKKKEPYEVIPLTKDDTVNNTKLRVQCETCYLWFENDFFLIIHNVVHRYTYKCSKCRLHFMSDIDRNQHNISCINPASPWICAICGKRFNGPTNLAAHRETHKDTKDLQCEMCGKAFKTKRNLKGHIKRCPALENRERKFSCEVCGNKFFENYVMRQHMETVHSDVRRFVCEICGAGFKSSMLLKRHLLTHKKDRPTMECEICGAGFRDLVCFKRHKKRHVEVCTERCTYCGKMFYERWNLKAHLRQHTGEKPYKCDMCGQGFTHNVSRKTHMKKCCKT